MDVPVALLLATSQDAYVEQYRHEPHKARCKASHHGAGNYALAQISPEKTKKKPAIFFLEPILVHRFSQISENK
jgi:hypothetical protein